MSPTSLAFLAVTAVTGLAVGGIYGISESAISSLWSRARAHFIGKVFFVVAFLLVGMVPFTVSLAAPFFFFRDISPELGLSGYVVLFGCLWLGLLAVRRLSVRRGQNAP